MWRKGPVHVAVVSPFALVRAGLMGLLQGHVDRVLVTELSAADGHLGHVDVVIYDLAGIGRTGEDPLRHLLAGRAAIVGLARDGRPDLTDGARALGIETTVPEDVGAAHLVAVLERVAPAGPRSPVLRCPDVLTGRELEVLRCIAEGRSNKEIAQEFYLSINSVKTYIRTAYRKTGVHRRPDAILWALKHGLVPAPEPVLEEHPGFDDEGGASHR